MIYQGGLMLKKALWDVESITVDELESDEGYHLIKDMPESYDSINKEVYIYHKRTDYINKYSWAIPTWDVIREISKYSPLIEIGGGKGYWAKLLQMEGADIIVYDSEPPKETFIKVEEGGPEQVQLHPDRTLFLCWPPYNKSLATDCLNNYKNNYLIYVGEGNGGCTANDEFHDLLEEQWEEYKIIEIPQWPYIHDYVSIYRRKNMFRSIKL